ncbi:TPA: hypothetical protein ACFO2M_001218 [Neisseria meningitidis]|nr:hypothetical protein [Neisseria meningitidis]
MTNQFKFGDRVIDKALGLGECVVINASENSVYIMNERGEYNVVARPETLEIVPHPDTERLDFVERIINIDGMVKREMMKGWVLVDDDGIEITPPKPLLRDAIDAAISLKHPSR